MYGSSVDDWISSRQALLDQGSQKVFSNPFLKRAGLDELQTEPPIV
jgi:hypothetical protein